MHRRAFVRLVGGGVVVAAAAHTHRHIPAPHHSTRVLCSAAQLCATECPACTGHRRGEYRWLGCQPVPPLWVWRWARARALVCGRVRGHTRAHVRARTCVFSGVCRCMPA